MSLNLDMTTKVWHSALPKGCNKTVLLCFCKHLNDTSALSWPGIPRVARMCGMSERTVQGHVRALQAAGILRARVITDGTTTHYSIHLDALLPLVFKSRTVVVLDAAPPVDIPLVHTPPVDNFENPAGIVDNSAPTPAVFAQTLSESAPPSAENDIEPVENCTLTSYVTPTNSERTQSPAPASPASVVMIDSVKPEVLADFAAIRKNKRKGPVTAQVIDELCQQASIMGMTLAQVLDYCCAPSRRWGDFKAEWLHCGSIPAAATVTTPTPAGALFKPPVSTPAAPEIRAAELQRLSLIRRNPPAPPAPVAGIQIGGTGAGWAHAIVNKHKSGQTVTKTQLREACMALRITPASLNAAQMH